MLSPLVAAISKTIVASAGFAVLGQLLLKVAQEKFSELPLKSPAELLLVLKTLLTELKVNTSESKFKRNPSPVVVESSHK